MRLIDLTGRKIGRLTVSHRVACPPGARPNQVYWLCRCECGSECIRQSAVLSHGKDSSCGCVLSEQKSAATRTHGMTRDTTYNIWSGMKARCTDVNDPRFDRYGGRGISICERWKKFENFFADMGRRPGPEYSLDRVDNNGNYEPGNCRWATQKVQSNNRGNNFLIEFEGRTQTLALWAEELGVSRELIAARIKRLGWPVDLALTMPADPNNKVKPPPEMKGEMSYAAKLTNSSVRDIREKLRQKMPIARIARLHNVSRGTVYAIKDGVTWSHVS